MFVKIRVNECYRDLSPTSWASCSETVTGTWRVGAGIGARYYTSIGPIRLDVAIPVNRQPHGDAFELYIGIGQAF